MLSYSRNMMCENVDEMRIQSLVIISTIELTYSDTDNGWIAFPALTLTAANPNPNPNPDSDTATQIVVHGKFAMMDA